MATAADIKAGRKNDAAEAKKQLAKTGVMSFIYKNYQGPGAAVMTIGSELGDDNTALKLAAIDEALRLLAAQGLTLPPMTFHCTSKEGVPCVAYMGNFAGDAAYTVFMGPKTGQHTPQVGESPVTGGYGKLGERGVADQVYDGTQRWFGNPKMHSHAATVVIHEIGHVLHEIANPALFWDFKLGRQADGVTVSAGNHGISVSSYAMKNPLEFVAEAFAGTIAGKKYPEPVMDFYRSVGGPPL